MIESYFGEPVQCSCGQVPCSPTCLAAGREPGMNFYADIEELERMVASFEEDKDIETLVRICAFSRVASHAMFDMFRLKSMQR